LFLEVLKNRVLVFDGAMGTSIHTFPLTVAGDFAGLENCSEVLNRTRPDVIQAIHERFLEAGSDIVETNTFGSNQVVLSEFGIAEETFELSRLGAQIARRAVAKFSRPDRPRFVVGSVGPGTKLPTLGHIGYDALRDSYQEQVRGLLAGGVDALLIETQQDLLTVKAALAGARRAMAGERRVPMLVQVTVETTGTLLVGSEMSAVVAALEPFDEVVSLGLNCATGPAEMGEHVQYLAHHWPRLISIQPNAGLPVIVDGKAHYPLTPADFAATLRRFVTELGVNMVGGCCGTTPQHLRALAEVVREARQPLPAARPAGGERRPQVASLYAAEDLRQDASYLIVAERTNTNGSKKFRTLLEAGDYDGMVAMARDEIRDGSHVLDVCVDFVGRDGKADMQEVVHRFVQQAAAPLMLDSTDPAVMEVGLKLAGGRCLLNSMNLEDGEERVARISALAKEYGACVVCGTIDEDKESAMARTADRKLSIAQRLYELAVHQHGLRPHDLLFDPLVLPISTGIEADRRNALETIEGIRRISEQLPECFTIVGLSNVSFGLKPAARVVLNSAFLHECRRAGLTSAIVHASKLLPENRIPPEQWAAAMDLIYDGRREGHDPLTHFISLFKDEGEAAASAQPAAETLTIEERLKRHIIDGDRRDLVAHLDEARAKYSPLEIINTLLLEGMKVVGELFGSGQMQLPFVLQSAETMKAAVAHLEQFMEKSEGSSKGRIVLATVKGDVHDIGKNLVDIILTNNGYKVYNLGIKQPVAAILHAAEQHSADAIGMSGLLVKSVAVMRENLEEMNARGVRLPVLLGGAALTRNYAEEELAHLYQAPLFYCKDAFEGLRTMDSLAGGKAEELLEARKSQIDRRTALRLRAQACAPQGEAPEVAEVQRDNPVPTPPFWGSRIASDLPLKEVYPYINELALFRGQWGFKKGKLSDEEFERLTEEKARPVFARLGREAMEKKLLQPAVVYGYFPCAAEGDDVVVYHPDEFEAAPRLRPGREAREWVRFRFPRQEGRRRLSIADFFRTRASGEFDVLGLQLVTMGQRATEHAQALFAADQYQEYLYFHGFAVESAEALAELWHKRMRAELGFASEDAPAIRDLFTQHYRGSRYSFGYGACPNLEDRAKITELLDAARLGVTLSESFMIEPEQSTDAIVVHHPQAKYFDV
jgi:5-methyltetrahydrofolate--homocysteine methyltransferase